MVLGSSFYKYKARLALKGNWQTALLVMFFTGILTTATQVLQTIGLQHVQSVMYSLQAALEGANVQTGEIMQLYNRLFEALTAIPDSMWIAMIAVNVLAIVFTPGLGLSCNRYFIRRDDGEQPALKDGLFGCMRIWLKALWLHVIMFVRIFLWSLLFVIPGIIAAIRYSMAPWYMAEDPSMSAGEAIRRSKQSMNGMKMAYFVLQLSFVIWMWGVSMAQVLLVAISPVIAQVASLFLSLMVSTYLTAATAAFYCAVSREGGQQKLVETMGRRMREMGMETPEWPDMSGDVKDSSDSSDEGDA